MTADSSSLVLVNKLTSAPSMVLEEQVAKVSESIAHTAWDVRSIPGYDEFFFPIRGKIKTLTCTLCS